MTLRHLLILVGVCVLLTSVDRPAIAGAEGNWRFGVIESYESPSNATRAGAAWTRVRFQWAEVQAGGPDTWTPPLTDEQINGEIDAGRLVTGMLIGIPEWARDADLLPAGLWLPHTDAGNTWATFVRQAVGRYNGLIDHWIIWNEPDVWDTNAPGHTWDGSVEDFAQLLRTAYLVAKETNPEAVIHLAAMTYYWDFNYGREQYLDRLLDVIAADPEAEDNDYYFDVLTAHLYFQPQIIYDIIQEFDKIRAANGIPWKPIWLVETNAPPMNDPAWPVPNWTLEVTIYEQAAFMPQALAAALAAGAERIAVFKLKDTPDDRAANPEPFGLLRRDGSRRPAFTTYQVAVQYLSGATAASRERWDSVGQFRVVQGEQTTTVLFSRLPGPQQAQVAAAATTATLVDMWGTWQTITASDGVFNIELPGSSCSQSIGDYCMIGGTTYYLVQTTGGDATATSDPNALTNTPTPTDTPAATGTPRPTNTPRPTDAGIASAAAAETASPTTTSQPSMTPDPTATPAATQSSGQVITAGNTRIWLVGGGLALAAFLLAAGRLIRRRQGSQSMMKYPKNNILTWLSGLGLLFLLTGFWRWPAQRPATAQSQPVVSDQVEVDFPNTVTFRLELAPDVAVADARLTYRTGRSSCLQAGTQVPVEVDGSLLEWTWVLSRSGNPPPGAEMWWQWTVTDTNGQSFTTEQQKLTFEDDRFDWQTISAADVGESSLQLQLHWYEGEEVGPVLMDAAVAGLKRLQADMGITLQDTVQFFIYGDAADMRQAVLYIQDWAGGVAFSEYGIILIGVPPDIADSWGRATVRHELAHLVIDQFGRSCLGGSRPTWLNEGLAVYAEGEADEDTRANIERGIRDNSFAPVRSLSGAFPTHDDDAGMAYSQSFSLVDYLLVTYGPEKMQQLLLTLGAAEGYDQALEQVYGFNADGLEVAWRAAIGAPPRSILPTPTPILAANVPTVVPLDAIQPIPTPPEAAVVPTALPASEIDPSAGCAFGLAPLALLVLAIGRRPRRRT